MKEFAMMFWAFLLGMLYGLSWWYGTTTDHLGMPVSLTVMAVLGLIVITIGGITDWK